jgi:hypothetical protein
MCPDYNTSTTSNLQTDKLMEHPLPSKQELKQHGWEARKVTVGGSNIGVEGGGEGGRQEDRGVCWVGGRRAGSSGRKGWEAASEG